MICKPFDNLSLSCLGLGNMRLPTCPRKAQIVYFALFFQIVEIVDAAAVDIFTVIVVHYRVDHVKVYIELLFKAREMFKDQIQVPCTACRYCCDECPAKIDIPKVLSVYNEEPYSQSK